MSETSLPHERDTPKPDSPAPTPIFGGGDHDLPQPPCLAELDIPYHVFSKRVKVALTMIVSMSAMLSGLSSNVYFPAQRDIALVSTLRELSNFSVCL